ncbi:pleckstrin homology domain-containing family N member 1 isoform X2 [Cyclopterus lumpus]|uniref:pleckstrin homology domain-containing family N member 1 isoform X2 n=1 Tax=Cyclopterus lumpus TaxID=8103 RepID=UPI0014868F2B|nr:pleckstrin homology domain-containing family N member 1 isoform X2 [Cyclopterus lumpus]
MGSSMSCVPQHNFRFSSKSFIRRNSRLFRKNYPQEGQEKSNSIINILCTVTPRKEMSHKDLHSIDNIKWNPSFPYDLSSGWKKSSINVKNYGRMIHSSKVRFRFVHCQDIHDCYLDLFETHLHFVSNNTTGLTYQGTLPLKEITICNLQQNCNHSQPQEFTFQINGVSLNPIIIYCSNQEDMDLWFGLLKENIEANGGSPIVHENYTRVKLKQEDGSSEGREELRNSVNREPIYEWEGSQRDSLGIITYVTKVQLQHLPCQEQSDRLLVLYPSTLIILSEENNGLFYKGKLPLNMITVTTPCQDVKPNTFMIEGKLINPIVVSCLDRAEFCNWIQHFKSADVPVLSPPPPVYDIIYTPTHSEAPQFDRWSGNSHGRTESLKFSHSPSGCGTHNLQLPIQEDNPLSPGYTEPLCYSSSRPSSTETARLGSRTNSVSSHSRPERDLRPLSLRYSSPHRSSYLQPAESSVRSQVYSTPYSALHRLEKAPLVKSKSWSTPQTSLNYSLNAPQRHSDMCAPRQPLSPLYDEPSSPEIYSLNDARPVQQSWQEPMHHHHQQQGAQLLPSSFQLHTPPMGRHCRRSLVMTNSQGQALSLDMEGAQSQAEQRAEAVSRLKLLPVPSQVQEQILLPLNSVRNTLQMPYGYSPDHNSYLEHTEPDDQEMDYDNIWQYDCDTRMIQPMSRISTELDFGARGLGAMATQQRWS